ncbi:AAA family ATPase [Streptomyces sp. 3MP-14]|uniref:AAA family ATPase n=1 Tax=Streptomyces mimosae TaxID=2586635 RepID=A0A5N6ASI9_9ACTN|nr:MULTISPECIES: AAA family ATPase [Streptomyces]KAB8171135.1 AAA family ATPase [Streptomyces mimosae]KAB8179513.1 AAA family ATPase [Streptomyces sp. 3MP-14]
MPGRLLELHVENFRSLRNVTIPLGPLTVLVGPNGAGKSNVLKVFDFLAAMIRTDLRPALEEHGGFDEVGFWGGERPPTSMVIHLKANWTTHASTKAPDEYSLTIRRRSNPNRDGAYTLSRQESFQFKRTRGRGRRITISGNEARVIDAGSGGGADGSSFGIQPLSSGLSTLPRLGRSDGGEEVARVAERLSSFRVFDVNVTAARQPTRARSVRADHLDARAENLAAFLVRLSADEKRWNDLTNDARRILPSLQGIEFEQVGGHAERLAVVLHERGLRRTTPLADASFGTVRLLGLLAMLYDPRPPALTCVEEIDHGLHPQALELIVERLREASERTQLIVATHSPALVDRLVPEEFVVCERDASGASIIPALTTDRIEEVVAESGDEPLGELWFSGVLGGDLTEDDL